MCSLAWHLPYPSVTYSKFLTLACQGAVAAQTGLAELDPVLFTFRQSPKFPTESDYRISIYRDVRRVENRVKNKHLRAYLVDF